MRTDGSKEADRRQLEFTPANRQMRRQASGAPGERGPIGAVSVKLQVVGPTS